MALEAGASNLKQHHKGVAAVVTGLEKILMFCGRTWNFQWAFGSDNLYTHKGRTSMLLYKLKEKGNLTGIGHRTNTTIIYNLYRHKPI